MILGDIRSAAPWLIASLDDLPVDGSLWVVDLASRVVPGEEGGFRILERAMDAADFQVVSRAIKFLELLGPAASPSAPALARMLLHPDPVVRLEAAIALSDPR